MAKQLIITAALIGVAIVAVVLSGRGGGGQPEVKLAPINHLNFDGIGLTMADLANPPLADQYPAMVAKVNGEDITGKSLASQEVIMELSRRGYINEARSKFLDQVAKQQLAELATTDPLEALIDSLLKRQAVQRLDLLPSHEEAVAYTQQQEDDFKHPRGTEQPGSREQVLENMRLQGLPTENWASSDRLVEAYRFSLGFASLMSYCREHATPPTVEPGVFAHTPNCDDWLKQERKHADIVYFVRWAD